MEMRIQHFCCNALVVCLLWAAPASAQDISEAARGGDLGQVRAWVEKDSQLVNSKDNEDRAPLHWASRGVHEAVLEYLIDNGADVNARDGDNVTALHSVSYRGDAAVMEILITNGAELDAKDDNGMTPLMYAAYADQESAVSMLIKHGAKVKVKDDSGLNVADIAEDQGHVKLAQYLLAMGAELTPVPDPEITQLTGNIHRITICYQQCTNMLVVDGHDDMLVIDTGYPRTTEKLKAAIHSIGKDKKVTVINTHQHHDHNGGNSIAGGDGNIISLKNLEQMTSMGILARSESLEPVVSGKKLKGSYTLNFNGHGVQLLPLPGAHTDDDMIVYFEDADIVHMGDLLISQSFPSLTRGAKVIQYMGILDKVINIFNERTVFVGGHGRNLQKQELVAYRDKLQETINIVTKGLATGKNAQLMQQDGVLNKYASYNTFIPMLNTEYWIGAICKSYASGTK
jgi:cyclase